MASLFFYFVSLFYPTRSKKMLPSPILNTASETVETLQPARTDPDDFGNLPHPNSPSSSSQPSDDKQALIDYIIDQLGDLLL